jgi:hypothetical protein
VPQNTSGSAIVLRDDKKQTAREKLSLDAEFDDIKRKRRSSHYCLMRNQETLKRIHNLIQDIETQLDEVKRLVSIAFNETGIDQDEIFVDAEEEAENEDLERKPAAIAKPKKIEVKPKKLTKEEKKLKLIDGRFRGQNWAWKEAQKKKTKEEFEEFQKFKRLQRK